MKHTVHCTKYFDKLLEQSVSMNSDDKKQIGIDEELSDSCNELHRRMKCVNVRLDMVYTGQDVTIKGRSSSTTGGRRL